MLRVYTTPATAVAASRVVVASAVPACLLACMLGATGCADPSGDFTAFQGRVGPPADSSAPVDTGSDGGGDGAVFADAGVAAFNGVYWGVCLDNSYAGDVSKVTYDVFDFTFAGGPGTYTVSGKRQALKTGAKNVAQVSGEVTVLPTTKVADDGTFAAAVAKFVQPSDSNGFGIDITVDKGVYQFGVTSPEGGCGKFVGKVISPLEQDLDETCVFARPAADGSFTPLTDTKPIHCP